MIHQHFSPDAPCTDAFDARLGTPRAQEVIQPILRNLEHIERCHGHMSRQFGAALGEYNIARNFNDRVLALVAMGIDWTEARRLAVEDHARQSNVVRLPVRRAGLRVVA